MEAPRDDLFRSTPPIEVRSSEDGRMTLFGHFSVFNRWTEIDSIWEGRFMERIAPGAFTKTLRESGLKAKIQWNHGRSDLLRDVLIAKPLVAKEDERGGYYEAELFRGLPEWLYEGLRENVYGASFRFGAVREEWVDEPGRSEHNPEGLPERTVTEARVPEWGPVSWPAYDDATAMVRSLSDRFHDLSTSADRAALVAPGRADAATPSITPDADDSASHLAGPSIRERRMRALQLRGVILQ